MTGDHPATARARARQVGLSEQPEIITGAEVEAAGDTALLARLRQVDLKAVLDENTYAPGIKVSDEELATLVIERDEFHGEWNYRLRPRDQHV